MEPVGVSMTRGARAAIAALVAAGLVISGAAAAEKATGPVTNLDLPRFVSLKSNKANIRRGPGLTHRIDWVFLRKGMPLQIVAEHGHWRKVRDVDDASGWVHHALLRGSRSAVVIVEQAVVRRHPRADAKQVAHAEPGVIFRIARCEPDWCEVEKGGFEGWVRKAELWGVGPDEVFD